jgi:hypothetical protein
MVDGVDNRVELRKQEEAKEKKKLDEKQRDTFRAQLQSQNQRTADAKQQNLAQSTKQSAESQGVFSKLLQNSGQANNLKNSLAQKLSEKENAGRSQESIKHEDKARTASYEAGETHQKEVDRKYDEMQDQIMAQPEDKKQGLNQNIQGDGFGGGNPDKDSKGGGGGQSSSDGQPQAQGIQGTQASTETSATGGTTATPEIVAQLVREIAKFMHTGVDEMGKAMVDIGLNDGVLRGTRMRITRQDKGAISLEFTTKDSNVKNLLSSLGTRGDLGRALENAGIRLTALTVK